MEDPWILPSLNLSNRPIEMDVSFPAAMIAYQENIDCIVEPSPSSLWMEEEDPYVLLTWAVELSHSQDCLDDVFPLDEAIIEAMSGLEKPWGELHHISYFLPKLDGLECDEFRAILREKVGSPVVPLSSPSQMANGSMVNLSLL